MRKKLKILLVAIFLLSILYFGRNFFLRQIAEVLVDTDPIQETEYAVLLSGNAKVRGRLAAELYHQGKFKKIICPGENWSFVSEVMDTMILEPEFSKKVLTFYGVPDSAIELLVYGSSTKEEADTILNYCIHHRIDEIAIISSEFHTRRMRHTYEHSFPKEGIQFYIYGAEHDLYNTSNWWQSESGLLNCNNEWIKLLLYIYKY